MLESLIQSFQIYYGLDWAALVLGMGGCYLLTNRNRFGFLLSTAGCLCGFGVAMISSQYGFIAYNVILVCLQSRGFIVWSRADCPPVMQAAE